MPGSATATRWPASARATGLVVNLDAADAHRQAGRRDHQLVALADRARPERSRHDGADPAEAERPVDEEARRARAAGGARRAPATCASAPTSSSRPSPVRALVATTGAPGTSSAPSSRASSQRLLVDRVDLRDRDDTVLDPEQADDREVLVRLRPGALGRVDRRAGRGRYRSPRRPCCGRTARGPGRR